jgi:acetyltransferase-like isoleucine patch superfamily enzyme
MIELLKSLLLWPRQRLHRRRHPSSDASVRVVRSKIGGIRAAGASPDGISIGNFCSMVSSCYIYGINYDHRRCTTYNIFRNLLDAKARQRFIWSGSLADDVMSKGPIAIGHDVWIGAQVVVLSGVRIGNCAVIAATSTVSSDIPPYAVVAGSPARLVKYRFPDEVVAELEGLQWWGWDDARVHRNRELFRGDLTLSKLQSVAA